MSVLQGQDRALERKLILDGAWPHFPMLPVKREVPGPEWLECGLVVWRFVGDHDDRPVNVYLANLVEVQMRSEGKTWAEAMEGIPVMEYLSLDAFFDAGWRGD